MYRIWFGAIWSDARRDIPAIFILPVELHISVFELVIDEENTAYVGFTPTFTIRRLMHVCRLWRSIATSTAVFWRYIDTTQPTPWVSLCLARSRACLLDVYVAFFPRQPAVGVDLVRPHARRIRSLASRIPSGCDGQGQYWKRLCPLFEAGMPQLQRLELLPLYTDSVFPRHQHAMVADYALSNTSLPRLRWLTTGMVVLPAPKDFWRSLRGLTLHDYLGPDANPRGFDELVDILAQNPALEELHVRCFGERRFTTATSAHQQASASPLGPGMARLPCLRRLSLYSHNDIVDFVPTLRSCLEVPRDVSTE
ncbi:hypothetical protein BN946_scf184714.g3 [Trametes cinnabarina]|uniref:F-box domain-containing protein n=1 Tax=Pycnoporus cinnabarinus TaxID=5643 RepID=A0A060SZ78_PYCCI|nr:hypothetical protein BN946_scf184714.g3 [Trametes cinnabarina]